MDLDFVWLAPAGDSQLVQTSDPVGHRSGELLKQPLEVAKAMGASEENPCKYHSRVACKLRTAFPLICE
eukprot:COSAG05_NODE_1544_length_4590_cov_25.006012_3_plen_69_part_00